MRFKPGFFRILSFFLHGIVLSGLLYSCATIVAPSGGDKDITPPRLVYSEPKNQSAHFSGNRLVLSFSEYIQLKEIEKNLLISPPMNVAPEMKIKGRSIVIKLKDTLRSNTTYSFYFGNAIVDLTEQNPLKNFTLAFSTGDVIDSLSLVGNVTDPFTRLPVKDVLVMLFSNLADSAPMLEPPNYVSRTNDAGVFALGSLASGKYRLLALKDGNNDYMYNLPTEQIAFYDSLVEPFYIAPVITDTSIVITAPPDKQFELIIFPEPDSIQRVQKWGMIAPHEMQFIFRYPTAGPELIPINIDSNLTWSIREFTPNHDTLTCWLTGSLPDSLKLKVLDQGKIIDTLELSTLFKLKSIGRKNQEADTSLKFHSVAGRSGYLDWNSEYVLTFANPLAAYVPGMIRLIISGNPDTLSPESGYADEIHRKMHVRYPWKTGDEYTLLFPKGTFTDIYGQVNDSVKSSFKLKPKDEYGIFSLQMKRKNDAYPLIIQLLSEKGAVVQQRIVTGSQKIDFGFLAPGKYKLKAIYDENRNGRWDTGILIRKKQPERTALHPKTFEVRGNWELEEEWEL